MSNTKIWYAPNGFEAYGDDEIKAVTECLKDGWLAGFGKRTIEFENKVSKLFGKKYGLFVNSGSSANLLALLSLKLKTGEVITPACTFATTVAPIIQCGLTPVFCDVELNTYVPSVKQVIEKITSETKAIMIPNLIGNKPDCKDKTYFRSSFQSGLLPIKLGIIIALVSDVIFSITCLTLGTYVFNSTSQKTGVKP